MFGNISIGYYKIAPLVLPTTNPGAVEMVTALQRATSVHLLNSYFAGRSYAFGVKPDQFGRSDILTDWVVVRNVMPLSPSKKHAKTINTFSDFV